MNSAETTCSQIDHDIVIRLGECAIKNVKLHKFLGIKIDSKLLWKEQVKYINSKISRSMGIIYKIKDNLTRDAKMILYYSLIYPHLQYCNLVWASAMKTVVQPLFILQKKIVRIISGAGYRDHTNPIFSELGILKLDDIHRLELLKFVFNQLQLPSVFTFVSISTLNFSTLRNKNLLRPPQPKSETYKRFVIYSGCIEWNKLSDSLRSIQNEVTFKMNVKKYLLKET